MTRWTRSSCSLSVSWSRWVSRRRISCSPAARAVRVAGAQLPQHCDQGVADQGVDLVDQQHRRLGVRRRPAAQHFGQAIVRPRPLQHLGPDLGGKPVLQRHLRRPSDFVQDGAHGGGHVFARGLAGLDVHVDAAVRPAAVQLLHQRQQGRGLAGLARRVEHEVALLPDQGEQLALIQAAQRRDAVVFVRLHRTGRVEEPHRYVPVVHGEIEHTGGYAGLPAAGVVSCCLWLVIRG